MRATRKSLFGPIGAYEHAMTFSDGKTGVVGSYRYVNPDGTMGGVVAETAEVEPGAYIHVDAIVGPGGKVSAGEVVPKGAYIDEDTKSF